MHFELQEYFGSHWFNQQVEKIMKISDAIKEGKIDQEIVDKALTMPALEASKLFSFRLPSMGDRTIKIEAFQDNNKKYVGRVYLGTVLADRRGISDNWDVRTEACNGEDIAAKFSAPEADISVKTSLLPEPQFEDSEYVSQLESVEPQKLETLGRLCSSGTTVNGLLNSVGFKLMTVNGDGFRTSAKSKIETILGHIYGESTMQCQCAIKGHVKSLKYAKQQHEEIVNVALERLGDAGIKPR